MNNWTVTPEERIHLRELAKKQLEYSKLPIMKEREERWYKHNDLKGDMPMIHFETWTCEKDLLPPLKCQSEAARNIELQLNREILNHEVIDDDRVVPSWYSIGWNTNMLLFDLNIKKEHANDLKGGNIGFHIDNPIKDLQEDMHLLKQTKYSVDRERTLMWKSFVEEVIGDILPVKIRMGSLNCSLTQNIIYLMGMETMMFSMIDYPDEFHQVMDKASKDYVAFFKWMEKEELLSLNNGNNGLAQGSIGFTGDLPKISKTPGAKITTSDLWGYMDSQETVGISPEMFDEFFFPYYLQVAEQFGLLSYGCCEPVHAYWGKSLSRLPGLRKISISPWCDEEFMGEVLRGTNTIYHRKPSPNFVGVGKNLDEAAFREHILKTIKAAKGCKLEFSFRDVYNLEGNPGKVRRAVQIVRELLENNWK